MEPTINLPDILERLEDDHELLQELAQLFLQDLPLRLVEIRDAVASRNARALQQSAHALKGSAGNLAAGAVFEVSKRLEQMGREGDLTHSDEAYALLQIEVARLTVALQTLAAPQSSN
ncbi:MAG: Hpt domain-containing protein [Candidatus Binatia bacterium]